MLIERTTDEKFDTIVDNYTKTLIMSYLREHVIDNPKVSSRVRKVVEEELKKIIKVEVL